MARKRRVTHHQSITLQHGDTEVAAETRDLSLEGLYVAVDSDAIQLHDKLTIGLAAADGSGSLMVAARVVRVRKDSFGRTKALGLELEKTDGVTDDWERHVSSIEKSRDDQDAPQKE